MGNGNQFYKTTQVYEIFSTKKLWKDWAFFGTIPIVRFTISMVTFPVGIQSQIDSISIFNDSCLTKWIEVAPEQVRHLIKVFTVQNSHPIDFPAFLFFLFIDKINAFHLLCLRIWILLFLRFCTTRSNSVFNSNVIIETYCIRIVGTSKHVISKILSILDALPSWCSLSFSDYVLYRIGLESRSSILWRRSTWFAKKDFSMDKCGSEVL